MDGNGRSVQDSSLSLSETEEVCVQSVTPANYRNFACCSSVTVRTLDFKVPELDSIASDPSISGPSRTPFVPISTHDFCLIVVRTWTGPDLDRGPGPRSRTFGKMAEGPGPAAYFVTQALSKQHAALMTAL